VRQRTDDSTEGVYAVFFQGEKAMVGHDEKLCWELCELAAIEQDPEKVLAIAREIRRLLDESERRIKEAIPRQLEARPHSVRILDYSSTMSQYEIESLAAEATLVTEKKRKRQKQCNPPTKRKVA
jgi:hypothetical protein